MSRGCILIQLPSLADLDAIGGNILEDLWDTGSLLVDIYSAIAGGVGVHVLDDAREVSNHLGVGVHLLLELALVAHQPLVLLLHWVQAVIHHGQLVIFIGDGRVPEIVEALDLVLQICYILRADITHACSITHDWWVGWTIGARIGYHNRCNDEVW